MSGLISPDISNFTFFHIKMKIIFECSKDGMEIGLTRKNKATVILQARPLNNIDSAVIISSVAYIANDDSYRNV